MIKKQAPSFSVKIWMAGDVADAERVCREYCFDVGLCVTVTPTNYIYTGGAQSGFVVGLINYARFPTLETDQLVVVAEQLAEKLMYSLFQNSFSIETPVHTYYYEREKDD